MVAAAVFVAGVLVGADSMSRAIGVPTYIADVIVAGVADRRCWWRPCWRNIAVRARRRSWRELTRSTSSILAELPFWIAVLRIATPLILGTLGVLLCERAGVLNLGIEGIMVAGAFTGWLAVYRARGCGPASRWRR